MGRVETRKAIEESATVHVPSVISQIIADYLPCYVCEGALDTSYALKILWEKAYAQERIRRELRRERRRKYLMRREAGNTNALQKLVRATQSRATYRDWKRLAEQQRTVLERLRCLQTQVRERMS